jgi:hypothetical protein
MKYLMFLLVLNSCSTFKDSLSVGQCYTYNEGIFQVIKVGDYSFLLDNKDTNVQISYSYKNINSLTRMDCFDRFKDK